MGYADLLKSAQQRRNTLYLTPDDFLRAACQYFKWCEDNPIQEEVATQYKGEVVRYDVAKVRPFTKRGLAMFLGIPTSRLEGYKKRAEEGWSEVAEMIEETIYTQKFEHAAAGLLNSSIISRDLGLAEKTVNDNTSNVNLEVAVDEEDLTALARRLGIAPEALGLTGD